MKIKDDILKWQEALKVIAEQNKKMLTSAETLKDDVKVLGKQVSELIKISQEMANAMLSLIRQQIGD